MNGYFVDAVIYADDITLLGPIHSSILSRLNVCDVYARKMDILLTRRKPIFKFPQHIPPSLPWHFLNIDIVCISGSNHDISVM